jgi:hypothetical protein
VGDPGSAGRGEAPDWFNEADFLVFSFANGRDCEPRSGDREPMDLGGQFIFAHGCASDRCGTRSPILGEKALMARSMFGSSGSLRHLWEHSLKAAKFLDNLARAKGFMDPSEAR